MIACDQEKKSGNKLLPEKEIQPEIAIPEFSGDSAYYFVERQVNFGPRVPNMAAHKACAVYLVEKLKSYTPQVIEQDFESTAFDGTVLSLKNIIASFNPGQSKGFCLLRIGIQGRLPTKILSPLMSRSQGPTTEEAESGYYWKSQGNCILMMILM